MTKHMADISHGEIELVEITRQTLNYVWFPNGRREAMRSEHQAYFDTFEEAKYFLKNHIIVKIDSIQKRLDNMKRKQIKINGLKEEEK